MTEREGLKALPADQQAVISLLVRQGRTYAQVAAMLGIGEGAVRGRAQQALAGLGGGAVPADLQADDAAAIGDYVLGQLDEGEKIQTLSFLLDSPAGRDWGRTLAAQLDGVASVELPQIPAEPDAAPAARPRRRRPPEPAPEAPAPDVTPEAPLTVARRRRSDADTDVSSSTSPGPRPEPEPETAPAPRPRRRRESVPDAAEPAATATPRAAPVRRTPESEVADGERGGVVGPRGRLVLVLAALLVVAAVIVFATDSKSSSGTAPLAAGPIPASLATTPSTTTTAGTGTGTTPATGTTGTGTTSASNPQVLAAAKLTSKSSKAQAELALVQEKSVKALAFYATGLPSPGNEHYVIWLYNSPKQFYAVGKFTSVGKSGTVGPLASQVPAGTWHGVLLTLETSDRPSRPGKIVLQGTTSTTL